MQPSRRLADEYSAKSRAYADLWSPVIRPMALDLLTDLPLAAAQTVVDLGAGTGALLPDLALAAPGAEVIGVDRSEGMLRVAQHARGRRGLALMDAASLGLQSGSVDVAVLVFMLFHVPKPLAALREVGRALRACGTLGLTTWGRDHSAPGSSIWVEELDAHGAGPDPRDAEVTRHHEMDTPEKLEALLVTAELEPTRAWRKTFEHQWTTEALLALQAGCSMPSRRLATLPHAARESCQMRVRSRLSRFKSDDLTYRPEVLFATARSPA